MLTTELYSQPRTVLRRCKEMHDNYRTTEPYQCQAKYLAGDSFESTCGEPCDFVMDSQRIVMEKYGELALDYFFPLRAKLIEMRNEIDRLLKETTLGEVE